jgi:hypothetical protein
MSATIDFRRQTTVAKVVVSGFDGGMLNNGNFSDGTNHWSIDGGWSIGSGVATFDNATNGNLSQASADMVSSVAINTSYTLTFDVVASPDPMYLGIRTADGNILYTANAYYAAGSRSVVFTTPADIEAGGIAIRGISGYVGNGGTVTNIKLILTP